MTPGSIAIERSCQRYRLLVFSETLVESWEMVQESIEARAILSTYNKGER
jgi:hypothetical protein